MEQCKFGDAAGGGKETRSEGAFKEAAWQYAQCSFKFNVGVDLSRGTSRGQLTTG
jgi:hypothetical protein